MYRKSIEYLKKWKNRSTRKPLIIRGARQVGKSYLVRILGESEFDNILELNFERDYTDTALFIGKSPHETLSLLEAKYKTTITKGKTLIFLDEIQASPEVIAVLRYFYEDIPDLHIIAAGSLLDFTLNDHHFSMPVARIEYMHIGPMDFEEFLLALGYDKMVTYLNTYSYGDTIDLHEQLMSLVKKYWIIGGMPEAVKSFAQNQVYDECDFIKQTILSTYRDDFAKYTTRAKRNLIDKVFTRIPKMTGRKCVYTQIDRNERNQDIKRALELLVQARVITKVTHSNANGIPLGAEANERHFKTLFLDIGLLCRSCSLSIHELETDNDITLINSGALAEQFVGQHLLYQGKFYEDPELYYWMRQKKTSNAEVDYLLSIGPDIIPVEVKAGKTGSLKSLHMFLCSKQRSFALRFNSDIPSVIDTKTSIAGYNSHQFRLLSLPFYLIGQAKRLCIDNM